MLKFTLIRMWKCQDVHKCTHVWNRQGHSQTKFSAENAPQIIFIAIPQLTNFDQKLEMNLRHSPLKTDT